MFTNNYILFRDMMFFARSGVSFINTAGVSATARAERGYFSDIGNNMRRGRCRTIVANYTGQNPTNFDNYNLNPGVYFGSGSTPANKTDYCLESPITSGLTIVNPDKAVLVNDGNGKYSYVSDFIVRNTGDVEVNIWEVGLFSTLSGYGLSDAITSSSTWPNVLFERTVLTDPVNIQPGESKLITYKVTFNQTLNVE